MTATKLAWVKSGGHTGSHHIIYTEVTKTELQIMQSRIGGEWGLYTLYRNDKCIRGFKTLAEAKAHAETM